MDLPTQPRPITAVVICLQYRGFVYTNQDYCELGLGLLLGDKDALGDWLVLGLCEALGLIDPLGDCDLLEELDGL